jgi:hypothetical protein
MSISYNYKLQKMTLKVTILMNIHKNNNNQEISLMLALEALLLMSIHQNKNIKRFH